MNYGAFTNDSEVVRGALHADDTLKARGEEIRFRVRETAEWKNHAADLEMEMIKRGMIFEMINWSQGQAELPL
jgi:Arc/MetJ-type ribon-helix-helix transcriptional regulator